MKAKVGGLWFPVGAAALVAYIALNSLLGMLLPLLTGGMPAGTGGRPEGFPALWAASALGDAFFIVGSIAAVALGLLGKQKRWVLVAILVTWLTYSLAADATLWVPSFGEGESTAPSPGNLGNWLLATPIMGLPGLIFTGVALFFARRFLRSEHERPLADPRPADPARIQGP